MHRPLSRFEVLANATVVTLAPAPARELDRRSAAPQHDERLPLICARGKDCVSCWQMALCTPVLLDYDSL